MIRDWIEKGAAIVDVRSIGEFQMGHNPVSINIPLHTLPVKLEEIKDKKIVLACASGGRASQAELFLKKKGIQCINAGSWQNTLN